MLTIRAEQMRILSDASMETAIEAMMRQRFPHHCERLGRRGTIQTIRDATSRGRALGFLDAQLPAYVALEFSFGTDFSENPVYPWAQQILQDRNLASEPRMHRLRTAAMFYLARLAQAAAVPSEAGA
jgi:hypothetical protein